MIDQEGCPNCRNDHFGTMTPKQRFNALDRMATQLFGSNRWKAAFARRYGMTVQGLDKWRNNGAPVWAVEAIRDALAAQRLEAVRDAIRDADPT